MDKKDLLIHCRYYKGDDSIYEDREKAALSAIEKLWIDKTLHDDNFLNTCLEEYIEQGMRTFEQEDDTPVTLKAILFNRYNNELVDIAGFKEWYKKYYSK